MTQIRITGEDGREYIVSSESDIASKVTKIGFNYIYIESDIYDSAKDRLNVRLFKPVPLSEVPLKDIMLIKKQ